MDMFINNGFENSLTKKNDTIIDTSIFINVNDAILTKDPSVNIDKNNIDENIDNISNDNISNDNINSEDSNVNSSINENSIDKNNADNINSGNNNDKNNNEDSNVNNEESNINENSIDKNNADNINSGINDSTELENVNNIIIQILEDHGYKGIDLLNQLSNIYDIYQTKFIKLFKIQNYTYFTILKDTIWYNWENEDKKKGVSSLKYFGTKFPYITHLFDGVNIVPNIYLHNLNTEIEQIINLWKETDKIILANIHTDSNIEIKGGNDKPSLIIIYDQQENPRKYFKDMQAVNALLDEEQYIYCKLLGRINKETNGKIIFNILIDLQNAIKEAILYNKDLSLIIDEKTQ